MWSYPEFGGTETTENEQTDLEEIIDPLQVSQAIRQALPPEDQPEITFGTGFFSKDASPLSPQARRDVLNRLFSGLLENDQIKRGEERS